MGRRHLAYDYNSSSGVIIPDTSTILNEVQSEYQTDFGSDLDLTPSTPQGLMISAETLDRSLNANLVAEIGNQINPNLATGVWLDAICALFDISRVAATPTTVTATLTGTNGTLVPSGTRAQTIAGDIFQLITDTTIVTGGTIDASFQSEIFGSIPCGANTLTTIVDTVLGLSSINNSSSGAIGINQQSDLSLWSYRKKTLGNQGTNTTDAIISSAYKVSGVQSLQFRENYSNATTIIDTISMLPNSIYLCINGGTDLDIATAIEAKRSAGVQYNGSVSVSITKLSGQLINVLFDRPTTIPILIRVTVKLIGVSGSVTDTIKKNIIDYSNGLIAGENGFVVGGSISPFDISGAISSISGVYVKLVEIAPVSTGVYQTTELAIAINQIATTSLSSITVVTI